jgi:hypothetical protein
MDYLYRDGTWFVKPMVGLLLMTLSFDPLAVRHDRNTELLVIMVTIQWIIKHVKSVH